MEWNEFCEKTSNILGAWKRKMLFEYDDDKIKYTILSQEYIYSKEDYTSLKQKAEQFEFKQFYISDGKTYESIVSLPNTESRRLYYFGIEEKLSELSITDDDAKIEYSFKEISNELLWFIIKNLDDKNKINFRIPLFYFERKIDGVEEKDLFSLLKLIIRIPFSVVIKSTYKKNADELQKYAKSFLFNIAYNYDLVLKIVTEIDNIFPQREALNLRRSREFKELMAPRLSYKDELTEQYYMALVSEEPFVKFIGFYHIMEHFYEDVYNEDIFKNVQHIIQHPGFSAKRTKDIVKIVDLIKKKTRQSKEEFQGSELEALELTLKKYVDISELIDNLNKYSDTIINYYKTSEVSFSKGDAVDLKEESADEVYKKLATRIYKTRNSLVHSKSNETRTNERGIYKPFENSKELFMEIPLMKYISEEIIINSSSAL